MKIEQIVADREYGKRLEELGVKGESLFYYALGQDVWSGDTWDLYASPGQEIRSLSLAKNYVSEGGCGCCSASMDVKELVPAWTAEELGVMLPDWIYSCKNENGQWFAFIESQDISVPSLDGYSDKESNARAKMLIHLLENKIITVDEVNERMAKA